MTYTLNNSKVLRVVYGQMPKNDTQIRHDIQRSPPGSGLSLLTQKTLSISLHWSLNRLFITLKIDQHETENPVLNGKVLLSKTVEFEK